jgi:hypothetical protein
MSAENPLARLLAEWLHECDFAVLNHGFADHGRDYHLVIQDCLGGRPGTHRLTFRHVIIADYRTALNPKSWSESWDNIFLDWDKAKDLSGYIWGTNWSNAYPGLTLLPDDSDAVHWSEQCGHFMHAVRLETDRFSLRLVYHDVSAEYLSEDTSLIQQVIHPLTPR